MSKHTPSTSSTISPENTGTQRQIAFTGKKLAQTMVGHELAKVISQELQTDCTEREAYDELCYRMKKKTWLDAKDLATMTSELCGLDKSKYKALASDAAIKLENLKDKNIKSSPSTGGAPTGRVPTLRVSTGRSNQRGRRTD
ncbi:MAG: hypothetical protein M1828_005514 [Chrysothrix sp. TS-e1954]|nr:MAG: hypothetical protein M1828_005514 [Chrysothrix sp. TS-e1954]